MYTTNLRKVGGSVMIALPRVFLDALHLKVGGEVKVDMHAGGLLIVPQKRKYALNELLAQCDAAADIADEDKEWLSSRPVGKELL